MPIAQSLTQVQIYAVSLTKKLMKKFPEKGFYLGKLTAGSLSNISSNIPEHFIITKKGRFFFRSKALEGISIKRSGTISIWEKDEEVRKEITFLINKENKHSLVKFKIEFK